MGRKQYIDRFNETIEFGHNLHTLNDIGQGFESNQRLGNRIRMTSIELRMEIRRNVTFTTPFTWTGGTFRWMLIVDTQRNGASSNPALEDILDVDTEVQRDVVAMSNPNNRERYRIIEDKTITWGHVYTAITQTDLLVVPDVTLSSEPWVKYIHWKQEVDLHAVFKDSNGSASSIMTGNIYLLYLTNCFSSSIPFPNAFEIAWVSEIRFKDDGTV